MPPAEIEPRDLDAETAWLGAGYGHRTPEAERTRADAAAQEGLELDPVYTAKAMTGLLALRAAGQVRRRARCSSGRATTGWAA